MLVALVLLALPAAAHARRTYCSPSGDYCLGMFKRSGRIHLGLDTFSLRGRYRLCVTSPNGKQVCRTFRLRRDRRGRGIYSSHPKWSAHFPHNQRGRYRAVWIYDGFRLPSITFTVGR